LPLPRSRASGARFISVELQRVRLRLGGHTVLRDVSWRIAPGQRWVLIGENGAGKTLLLKLLAGDLWPTPGGRSRRRYRLGREVFEDPYGIREEIAYLGPERQDRYEHYEWNHRVLQIVGTGLHRTDIPLNPLRASDRQRLMGLLSRLHIQSLAARRFLSLSYGERRLVLLARALAWRPRLLLLDEPFSGLDPDNRERLAAGLRSLSRSALPWVVSTHRIDDLSIPATHLCRLESGRIAARSRLNARFGRRSRKRSARARVTQRIAPPRAGRRVLLGLRNASVWRDGTAVLRNLSLAVKAGQCWVVHGANGSGKSTLIQTLYGDLGVATGGSIVRDGVVPGVPLWTFQRRVGLVAPELQAILPRQQIVDELVAAGLPARERRRVLAALRRVDAARLRGRTLRTLSYGQMRRVLFARALVNEPDILLLDEPYAGLDARTRAALCVLIERAIEAGATAVITTHHEDEWPAATSHELQLCRGGVRYCGPVRRA
jgi:molybdate transport system ATP-binding protein